MNGGKENPDLVRTIFIAVMPVAIIVIVIFPIPAIMLDILIILSLLFAFTIFITTFNVKKSKKFSSHPALILCLIVFSLAVNISAVRLILTMGADFDGRLIRSISFLFTGYGEMLHLIVGFVIFIILVALQLGLISRRANRVSEAAARLAMDSMPEKQMAIDSKYTRREINEEETAFQKEKLQNETNFFGSLDGVCKFISGYGKVNIMIVFVNIICGTFFGTVLRGDTILNAIKIYVPLAVGNGFLSMLPVLFISLAVIRIHSLVIKLNVKGIEKNAE